MFPAADGSIGADLLAAGSSSLKRLHDPVHGGFGDAPKFPPHMALLFLLRHYQRTGDAESLEIARHTAEAMARGGLYDQLAGGFARYSVDGQWLVPHFEKMLYDNALLLRVYTLLGRLTGDPLARRVARETVRFLTRDLFADAFVSSLDADTGGVEGATYVWTPAQLRAALGEADGAWAADLLDVTDAGNFEHGTSVLRLARDVDADPDLTARWDAVRERLLAARNERPQPSRDDKVVAAWNGLAITALVEYAMAGTDAGWPDPTAADFARRAAQTLADRHLVDGRLRRVSRDGVVGEPWGVLEDYGSVAEAFCAVHQLTGEGRWLDLAGHLLDTALDRFGDGQGGFFDTADDAERLVSRPADPTDNATPSGLSAVAAALTTYTALTGQTRYREAAERALATVAPVIERHARFAGYAAATAEAQLSGPFEIAVADPAGGSELSRAAWRSAPPGAVVVTGEPDRDGVPLLVSRPAIGGAPTAYVCRGFVCDRPVTTVEDLTRMLSDGHR
jgi:uncharacterized protein YyaL (SSP411 family)